MQTVRTIPILKSRDDGTDMQICDLETVQPQEIPVNVCVMFYNALSD